MKHVTPPAGGPLCADAELTRAFVESRVRLFVGVAGVTLVLAALYANHYVIRDHLRLGLPDVSPTYYQLARGFEAIAVCFVGWALLFGVLSHPRASGALRRAWDGRLREVRGVERVAWAVAAGFAVLYAAVRVATNAPSIHASFSALTAGEAYLPFQYRALVPWLVRAASAVVPLRSEEDLAIAYGAVDAVAALGAYAAFRHFLTPFVPGRRARALSALALLVPLFFNLAAPYRYNALFFPWDTASLAFFTLGVAALYRRDWRLFYPLFVVATLNRETTCFLTALYVLAFFREERISRLVLHTAAQGAIWVGVKAFLWRLYGGNPVLTEDGGLFVSQVPRSLGIVLTVPGLMYPLVAMGGLWFVVLVFRRYVRDPRLTRAFRVVPFFLVGMWLVGELHEVRIYSELLPLVTAAFLLIVRNVAAMAGGAAVHTETEAGDGAAATIPILTPPTTWA